MAGNHRVSQDTISIIRTVALNSKDEVRRPKSHLFRENGLRFPVLRSSQRASQRNTEHYSRLIDLTLSSNENDKKKIFKADYYSFFYFY